MRTKRDEVIIFSMFLLGLAGISWAIPPNLTVTGRLLDKNGNPIHFYTYDPIGGKQSTPSF